MYFQQMLNQQHGCASYLIASRSTGEAAIIDPGYETEQYEAILRLRDFRLRYVIDSHIHADHISGARTLAGRHSADLCLHALAQPTYAYRSLVDGEDLELGQLRLHVWHTPGHRAELISLLVSDTERSNEPSLVLTADSLLAGDVGRPDFGGGDAAAQFESVQRILSLPDWVAVFPGHFEGPCGRQMDGRPSTTIGFERRFNPLAQLDRAAFLAAITTDVPARPLNMTAIEATNRGVSEMSWAMLTTEADVPTVDLAAVEQRPAATVLLDVREPEEYARGHVAGAVNIPQAELATRLDELAPDRALLVICQSGGRSLRATQFLMQRGYPLVANVSGGTSAWRAAGRPVVRGEEKTAPYAALPTLG